ncbi:MAG TPA: hypothetical protein VFM46_05590 [Pseudomonadales bacterium]|nr:hypothetical protein [Pseudomonadales bacterium]
MSTPIVVLIVIVGVIVLFSVFYINHNMERQRLKRAVKIAEVAERARRGQILVDSIPAFAFPRELRIIILNEIIRALREHEQLDGENKNIARRILVAQAQLEELQNTPTAQGKIKNKEEAKEIRDHLGDLLQYMHGLQQRRLIDPGTAAVFAEQIRVTHVDMTVAFFCQLAQEALRQNKPRVAVHNYQRAVAELQKNNKNGGFKDQIANIQRAIQELQAKETAEDKPKAKTLPTADAKQHEHQESQLDREMDSLLTEKDAWKKKKF